jgi:hypothetical protein
LDNEDLEDLESQNEESEDRDKESNEECFDGNQSCKEAEVQLSKKWWQLDSE